MTPDDACNGRARGSSVAALARADERLSHAIKVLRDS
jgi:hypothetical protein